MNTIFIVLLVIPSLASACCSDGAPVCVTSCRRDAGARQGGGDCELNNLQLTTAIEAEGFRECDQDMDLALSWAEMSACIVSRIQTSIKQVPIL